MLWPALFYILSSDSRSMVDTLHIEPGPVHSSPVLRYAILSRSLSSLAKPSFRSLCPIYTHNMNNGVVFDSEYPLSRPHTLTVAILSSSRQSILLCG